MQKGKSVRGQAHKLQNSINHLLIEESHNYRQAGCIGTGGVNRDTYHLVLAKAFILLYNILFFLENICCQVNDNI